MLTFGDRECVGFFCAECGRVDWVGYGVWGLLIRRVLACLDSLSAALLTFDLAERLEI